MSANETSQTVASPSQLPIAEPTKLASEIQATNESLKPSAAVDVSSSREELVENAVKFLLHPRVRNSPREQRIAFLKKKGLAPEEINDALNKAAKRSAPPASAEPSAPVEQFQQFNEGRPGKAYAPPVNYNQQLDDRNMHPSYPSQQIVPSGPSWSRVLLASGLLVALGGGLTYVTQAYVIPYIKERIRERQAAARARAEALAQALESTALSSEVREIKESLAKVTEQLNKQNADFHEALSTVKRLMETAGLQKSGGLPSNNPLSSSSSTTSSSFRAPPQNNTRALSPRSHTTRSPSPHTPVPDFSNYFSSPTTVGDETSSRTRKPWERPPWENGGGAAATATATRSTTASLKEGEGWASKGPVTANGDASHHGQNGGEEPLLKRQEGEEKSTVVNRVSDLQPKYSQSFLDVLNMVSQGKTPADVRTDIDDRPPAGADIAPSTAKLSPPTKPWERSRTLRGGSSAPSSLTGSSSPSPSPSPSDAALPQQSLPLNDGGEIHPSQSSAVPPQSLPNGDIHSSSTIIPSPSAVPPHSLSNGETSSSNQLLPTPSEDSTPRTTEVVS